MVRRRVAVVAAGLIGALAVAVPVLSAGPAERDGLHSTRSAAFVAPDGTEVRLNGLNLAPIWANSPGKTWGANRYETIAAKGFNAVRLVLYWDEFEPARGRFDAANLATLDLAVARAKAAGLHVILDMVHLWGPQGMRDVPEWARSGDSVASIDANAGPYVRMLAERYADDPAVAAYDPVNEPRRWPIDQNAVLRMYDRLVTTIRSVAPHKIVMVEPTYGDSALGGKCADLSSLTHRDNVVVSVHLYYVGGHDDGFGHDCGQRGTYSSDGKSGYAASDPAPLRTHLQQYRDALEPTGLPLVVGEFGMGEGAPNRDRWVRDMVELLDERKLSRFWWEYWTSANGGALSATKPDGTWKPVADLLVGSPPAEPATTAFGGRPRAGLRVGPSAGDPTIMAAGDFTACRGAASCERHDAAKVRDVMVAGNPDLILGIGDFQYKTIAGIDEGFDHIFGPKPGGLWPKIRPTAGPTHDVDGCDDRRYERYWGRDPMKPYSFNLGEWHLISLPSAALRYDCDPAGVLAWLQADLAAHRQTCTLAFWQDPYFTRPTPHHEREPKVGPWVQALHDHGADVILQASNHDYQRFAPQDPDDAPDSARGLRAFVVGTGGIGFYEFTGTAPNLEASDATTHGALEMKLHAKSYDWRFHPAAQGKFSDAGSGRCH